MNFMVFCFVGVVFKVFIVFCVFRVLGLGIPGLKI